MHIDILPATTNQFLVNIIVDPFFYLKSYGFFIVHLQESIVFSHIEYCMMLFSNKSCSFDIANSTNVLSNINHSQTIS